MDKLWSYCLSGSGTRFFVFLGALRVLFAAGRLPKAFIGTSGGALMSLYIAAHYDPKKPTEVLDKAEDFLNSFEIHKLLDLGGIRWPQFWHGVWKGDLILAKLREVLPKKWSDMKLPVYVVTSNRSADCTKIWGEADGIEPALGGRASMSLPGFDGVLIQGQWHTDGGTRANYPLNFFKDDPNVIGLRFRPLAEKGLLMPGEKAPTVQTFGNKIEFGLDNVDDLIEATSRMHMEAAVKARTIMLDAPGNGLDFNVSKQEKKALIDAGAKSAQKWLVEQSKLAA